MTYSIVYDAIQTKTTRFEKPAPLINLNEVAAAIYIGYQQADLTPPELVVGTTVDQVRSQFLQDVEGNTNVNAQLILAIKDYPHENAQFDEPAKETYDYEY